MSKKVQSAALAVVICCVLSAAAILIGAYSRGESTADEGAEPSEWGTPLALSSEYIQTVTADPDSFDRLYSAPDDILSGSTSALLDYFLQTPFLGQRVYTCASTPYVREIDFSLHEAYRELVSRDDCAEELEKYAKLLLSASKSGDLDLIKFEKLIDQSQIKSLISDFEDAGGSCPSLQSLYSQGDDALSAAGS